MKKNTTLAQLNKNVTPNKSIINFENNKTSFVEFKLKFVNLMQMNHSFSLKLIYLLAVFFLPSGSSFFLSHSIQSRKVVIYFKQLIKEKIHDQFSNKPTNTLFLTPNGPNQLFCFFSLVCAA